MKMKLLSKKSQKGSSLRRFGTVAAIASAVLLSDSAKAQTIFSNPVGINVAAISAGKDLHVNGPIRFDNLSGTGTRVVTADANGDLGFTTLPTGTVPSGTSLGQSLLWDGSAWLNNDFLAVPNFTGGPEVLEIGNTGAIDFVRTIHYGGNVGLDLLPGSFGAPPGTWMSHGWRAPGNSLPPGENFTGTRTNWQDFAANIGMTDRSGGPEIDLNIQMQDFTVPVGDPLTNRIIFSGVSGMPPSIGVQEYATILGNGNMGIGIDNPLIRLQVQDGNIGQASAGSFGAIGSGNRWTAIGGRIPFGTSNPFIRQEGTRTQWDDYGVGLGLTDDIGGSPTIKNAILAFQDANADFTAGVPVLSQNDFILGARDGVGSSGGVSPANFRPYMVVKGNDGNVGIGLSVLNPNSKVVIRGDGTTAATSGLDVQTNSGTSSLYVSDNGLVGVFTTGALFPGGPFTSLAGGFAPPLGNVRLSVRGDITQVTGDFATSGDVYAASDARFKKDFSELKTSAYWKKVLNVTAYSYKFDNTMVDNVEFDERTRYGFKAQDVNAEIPELTKMWGEALTVNYIGFVPFLTAGIQEHEERLNAVEEATNVEALETMKADVEKMAKENETLKAENKAVLARLEKLEAQLSGICSLPCVQEAIKDNSNTQEGTLNDQPQLFQNEPNPFGSTTTIKYYIPTNTKNAQLRIVDNSGKQLGEYQLKTGKGQLEISAGTIPAGTYNYSLYVDNQVIDTKKMVIINY